jgi:twitching motility protein PilT
MTITELLTFSVKHQASDLHLSAGIPPMIRVHGEVKKINLPAMTHDEVQAMLHSIMSDELKKIILRIWKWIFHLRFLI